MRKALTVSALALAATTVNAACNGDTDLATRYGLTTLTASGGTAVTVTAPMSVCGFVVGTTPAICCTETQITTTIQTYINTLKGTLQTDAGNRDKYILEQRGTVIESLASLRKLNDIADDLPTAAALIAANFITYAETIAADFSALVENFETYQSTRATCMDALLKTQAALACASCMDTAPTGITATGTVAVILDDALVSQIDTACYPYIENSVEQSSIITVSVLSKGLASLVSALEKYIAEDLTGAATDLAAAYEAFNAASYSTTNEEKAASLPSSCTSTTCISWIENTLFATTGLFDEDLAILGGTAVTDPVFATSRLLSEGNERRLAATGGFVQDLDDITFTTGFESNPGDVDNTENANSALRNGVAACGIAALAMLF